MAHELEMHEGKASFVSARQDAWHRLGTVLPDTFGAKEAMEYAHLGGWNVRKVALQTAPTLDGEGVLAPLDIPEMYATVRNNPFTAGKVDVLGVVGSKYVPIQNEAHDDIINAVTDESNAKLETAGSLRGGRNVFLTMKLPDTMLIGGKDAIDLYLIALNSHDGTSAFRFVVSPVRVVCANTQAAALRSAKASFSIRHTSGASSAIAEARQALGLTFKFIEGFQEEADKMIEAELTKIEFEKVIDKLWTPGDPDSKRGTSITRNRKDALFGLWSDAATNDNIRGTRWAGYQSITEYLDHVVGSNAEVRAERVATGGADEVKQKAFALLQVA